jgi:hypothetical protein
MAIEEKLRRDVPGGSDRFYKRWAEYIHEEFLQPAAESAKELMP